MTYILTPPQIRNNPAPEYKIKNWGLTDKIVDDLHKWVEEFQPLQMSGYVTEGNDDQDDELRSTQISWIDSNTNPELHNLLGGVIHHANDTLYKYSITYLETLQYSVYNAEDKGHYSMHSDAGLKGVNNDSRKISFSCLLNDPSEFEGGDLTLMPDSIGYPIKLKQYEICFFPSWMPHKVVPVTKGTRISLVGWVHGPDFV